MISAQTILLPISYPAKSDRIRFCMLLIHIYLKYRSSLQSINIIIAQINMDFTSLSKHNSNKYPSQSIKEIKEYSSVIDIDSLYNQFIDQQAFQEINNDIRQEHRQFEDRLILEIQRDLKSLGDSHLDLMKQSLESNVETYRDRITNQIQRQMKMPMQECRNLKSLKADLLGIQLNQNVFVKKHFSTHYVMNRQMTEAGRYFFTQSQYLNAGYPQLKRAQKNQKDQQKLHILTEFYKTKLDEIEKSHPQQKEYLLKNVLPRKIAVYKKKKSKSEPRQMQEQK